MLFIISGPSGVGKTTLCKELIKVCPEIKYSVSVTTRPKRPEEVHGKDYYFISKEEFDRMVNNNELIEYALVHGHYYGTPRKFLEEQLRAGNDVLLDIDVQGGRKLRSLFLSSAFADNPNAAFIFIRPPSWEVLERRLRNRKQDTPESIELRLKNAKEELTYASDYDYGVVNDTIPNTVKTLQAIIRAAKLTLPKTSPET